ncbi:MAG TPA: Hpt domain-containing protein [Polyangiaceae bacterium]|nr:Hpt domain-containing protein [Polyangiaceae bacterium]
MARDRELDRLLAGEIERRLPALSTPAVPIMETRAALHSLKGSAAMAGYADLALVIGQQSARLRGGDAGARSAAAHVMTGVLERLRAGKAPFATVWPEPPPSLEPSTLDARYVAEYHSAMRDRFGEIDQALASTGDPVPSLEQAQRTVHSMKGASAAVGDDVTAWYCHGLEARLREASSERALAQDGLVELSRHRVLLALLVEDPVHGLERLRALTATLEPPASARPPSFTPPSAPPAQPTTLPPPRGPSSYEVPLRVSQGALDHVFERLESLDVVGDELAGSATAAARMGARLAELRLTLLDAVRRVGPARPWGPPAAALADLDATAEGLRRAAARAKLGAVTLRNGASLVRTRTSEMREGLTALRRTSMGWVFERVGSAVLRFADGQGKLVRVEIAGAEVTVDRAVAERLLDAVMQLARNAVAHGIQPPSERESAGKAALGTIWLRASREGTLLRVSVEDDGQGADAERIRRIAVERGFASPELLEHSTPTELMGLLLLPGMTTQEGADLLAGRGIGLDLVQSAVRRFGGTVQLRNGSAGGLVATLELPSDQGLINVLWVEERGTEFALPVSYAGRVGQATETPVPRLSSCLGERWTEPARFVIDLTMNDASAIPVGVDRVGAIEECSLRALPPRIAGAGPFGGAVLRADGGLRLALDGPALAARARVLSARVGRARPPSEP